MATADVSRLRMPGTMLSFNSCITSAMLTEELHTGLIGIFIAATMHI